MESLILNDKKSLMKNIESDHEGRIKEFSSWLVWEFKIMKYLVGEMLHSSLCGTLPLLERVGGDLD